MLKRFIMKRIHPIVKGLLSLSLLGAMANLIAEFIPAEQLFSTVELLLDLAIYGTVLLTVLGLIHSVTFILECDSREELSFGNLCFLFLPFLNLVILSLFLGGLFASVGA